MIGTTSSTHSAETQRFAGIIETMIIAGALVFVLLGTYAKSFGDPANSRLATVYALTEHGTFFIDPVDGVPNPFERGTIDKVVVEGGMLSSKPPTIPLIMTAQYIVFRALFGWTLHDPQDVNYLLLWMTMTFVGACYIIGLVYFKRLLHLFTEDPMTRVLLLFALAFGSQFWGYSINLNNHIPGAAMLIVSMYYALGLGTHRLTARPYRFMAMGFTAGLVFAFDLPGVIFIALAGLLVLKRYPRESLTYAVIAAAIPVGLHSGVLYATTGNPLPVQTNKDYYLYQTAYWRNPRGVDALNEPKGTYLFHMTFGRSGLFSLYPIMLLGIAGTIRAIISKTAPHRGLILGGFGAFLVLSLYYWTSTNNYGGESYGFRWYMVAMPFLLMMGIPVVERLDKRWQWVFIGLMLGLSCYSAWECTINPWRANQEWTTRFLGPTY